MSFTKLFEDRHIKRSVIFVFWNVRVFDISFQIDLQIHISEDKIDAWKQQVIRVDEISSDFRKVTFCVDEEQPRELFQLIVADRTFAFSSPGCRDAVNSENIARKRVQNWPQIMSAAKSPISCTLQFRWKWLSVAKLRAKISRISIFDAKLRHAKAILSDIKGIRYDMHFFSIQRL